MKPLSGPMRAALALIAARGMAVVGADGRVHTYSGRHAYGGSGWVRLNQNTVWGLARRGLLIATVTGYEITAAGKRAAHEAGE